MAKYKPWLKFSRTKQLVMALQWVTVFYEETEDGKGGKIKKGLLWKMSKDPGEKAPVSIAEFTQLFDTQRKIDTIEFGFGTSGKMVYMIARVANGKLKGPWGPVVSAIIP